MEKIGTYDGKLQAKGNLTVNVDTASASPAKPMRAALAELRVLEAAATPGDWCVDEDPTGDGATYIDANDTGACSVAMILSGSANAHPSRPESCRRHPGLRYVAR